jgi:hypothetical protein
MMLTRWHYIKDAFLQVPPRRIIGVTLYNTKYLVFRNLLGQRLGCACLVLALWKLCVGDVGLLLVQGTTFSWKVHSEWCTQHLHDTRRRPLGFFSWFLFAAAGLSLLPHRAGIQDDEIQRRKSKKESPSMIFGSTNFFQP